MEETIEDYRWAALGIETKSQEIGEIKSFGICQRVHWIFIVLFKARLLHYLINSCMKSHFCGI